VPQPRTEQSRRCQWLSAGGNETDLQRLAGWRSSQMVGRYGRSAADERPATRTGACHPETDCEPSARLLAGREPRLFRARGRERRVRPV